MSIGRSKESELESFANCENLWDGEIVAICQSFKDDRRLDRFPNRGQPRPPQRNAHDGTRRAGDRPDLLHLPVRAAIPGIPGRRGWGPACQHLIHPNRAAVGYRTLPGAGATPCAIDSATSWLARLDADGMVRIVASNQRSQPQNRVAADERLVTLVRRALVVPKVRRRTKPSRAAKQKRLTEKKKRGERKQERRRGGTDD